MVLLLARSKQVLLAFLQAASVTNGRRLDGAGGEMLAQLACGPILQFEYRLFVGSSWQLLSAVPSGRQSRMRRSERLTSAECQQFAAAKCQKFEDDPEQTLAFFKQKGRPSEVKNRCRLLAEILEKFAKFGRHLNYNRKL